MDAIGIVLLAAGVLGLFGACPHALSPRSPIRSIAGS